MKRSPLDDPGPEEALPGETELVRVNVRPADAVFQ